MNRRGRKGRREQWIFVVWISLRSLRSPRFILLAIYFERPGVRRFCRLWVARLRCSGGGASLNHRLMECDPSRVENRSHGTWNSPRQPQCLIPGRARYNRSPPEHHKISRPTPCWRARTTSLAATAISSIPRPSDLNTVMSWGEDRPGYLPTRTGAISYTSDHLSTP